MAKHNLKLIKNLGTCFVECEPPLHQEHLGL